MMMSKPESESEQKKKKNVASSSSLDAVADLERRLADLSVPESLESNSVPQFAVPPPPPSVLPSTTAAAPVTSQSQPITEKTPGGKNALLARIMAAQERAKQAQGNTSSTSFLATPTSSLQQQTATAPTSSTSMDMDYLDDFNKNTNDPLPPAFDSTLLPPAEQIMSPPTFDATCLPPPVFVSDQKSPPSISSSLSAGNRIQFDPMFVSSSASQQTLAMQAPSAPPFEDLMEHAATNTIAITPIMPPTMSQFKNSTNQDALDDEALQAILGIEGLTESEKNELIAEQLKIMKSIQENQTTTQLTAADAFESRSLSTVVQSIGSTGISYSQNSFARHGQKQTLNAIQDGTAIMVQCTTCENWMQVTGRAQKMFCPVCQTISDVTASASTNVYTTDEMDQMTADAKLAEQLQKEEYAAAASSSSAVALTTNREENDQTTANAKKGNASSTSTSKSWLDWLGYGTPAPAPAMHSRIAHDSNNNMQDKDRDRDRLDCGDDTKSNAAIAKSQPLFACVTDSIGAAVQYATSLPEDEEGNVHGVDASSLLAVTQVGRQKNNSSTDSSY